MAKKGSTPMMSTVDERELCKLVVVIVCLLGNYFSKAAVKEELVIEYLW